MKQVQFRGTGVALVTPFKDGKIDYTALERVIEHTLAGEVEYLVPLGTTGEAVTLSSQECRKVLDFTIKVVNERVPIVAGFFGDNDTRTLAQKIAHYNFDGCQAILSSSPAYSKPTQEGIYQHYMQIAKVSPLPIIIYNVPGRTASNLTAETTLRLAKASEKFMAVKEASGDLVQTMKIIKDKPEHFMVLSGDDPSAMATTLCGGDGVISVIGNVYPRIFSDMIRAALDSKPDKARSLNDVLLDLHQWLYVEGNPVGIKAALEIKGLCSKEVRLPLVAMQSVNYNRLKEQVSAIEKKHFEGEQVGHSN